MSGFEEFYLNLIAWLFVGSTCLILLTHILEGLSD